MGVEKTTLLEYICKDLKAKEFLKLIQASAFIKHTKYKVKEYVVNQKN
jgi:hypothetical protein